MIIGDCSATSFISGVGKLFGVEGRISPQGTCCGPDRYILREKCNNCGLAHPPHHDVMSYLQKHWEETWRFLVFCSGFLSYILFFQLHQKRPNFTRLVTEGSSVKGSQSASTSVREPINVDYQCATKSCSAWKQSLIVRYIFRAEFNVKTDEPPRAGWTQLAGRIWPAGQTLPTPDLYAMLKLHVAYSNSVCVHVKRYFCSNFGEIFHSCYTVK